MTMLSWRHSVPGRARLTNVSPTWLIPYAARTAAFDSDPLLMFP